MSAPITVPLVAGMPCVGATVLRRSDHGVVVETFTRDIARVAYDDGEMELYPIAELALVLSEPVGACLALRWLAERLGVPVPEVGCPGWEFIGTTELPPGSLPTAVLGDADAGSVHVIFVFGAISDHDVARMARISGCHVIRCPALPDGPLAATRALALAVVTVATQEPPMNATVNLRTHPPAAQLAETLRGVSCLAVGPAHGSRDYAALVRGESVETPTDPASVWPTAQAFATFWWGLDARNREAYASALLVRAEVIGHRHGDLLIRMGAIVGTAGAVGDDPTLAGGAS